MSARYAEVLKHSSYDAIEEFDEDVFIPDTFPSRTSEFDRDFIFHCEQSDSSNDETEVSSHGATRFATLAEYIAQVRTRLDN